MTLDQAMAKAIARLKATKKRQEAKMGGSGLTGPLGGAVGPNASSPQSNVKTPLADLLGGQALQGIANNAISYEQVSQLLQQRGQASLGQSQAQMAGFGKGLLEPEKQVRKPVVVEKKDPRARKIVLED